MSTLNLLLLVLETVSLIFDKTSKIEVNIEVHFGTHLEKIDYCLDSVHFENTVLLFSGSFS